MHQINPSPQGSTKAVSAMPIDVINEYSKVLAQKDLDFSTPENIEQSIKIKQSENPSR